MCFEKRGPGRLLLSVGCRFDAVGFEHITYRRVGDVVADVGQRALDAVIALRRILIGEPQDQIHNDRTEARSTDGLAFSAVAPFPRHE